MQSIIESGEALGHVFENSVVAAGSEASENSAPVIYMDLGAAESEYNYGGKVAVLDLSWYSRYKPVVDQFLSAVMWGFFIWRIFIHLPSIIDGTAVAFDFGPVSSGTRETGLTIHSEFGLSKRR